MKIIPKFILICLLLAAVVAVVISADQIPRRLTATEYSNIFSGTVIPEGEDKESPFVPWAVLVRFPWTESGSINNDSATLAFNDASSKFPASIVRFGELVLDTPDALAIADLFGLTQLPTVQVLHGQQGRFEQMKNMGGLPFAMFPSTIKRMLFRDIPSRHQLLKLLLLERKNLEIITIIMNKKTSAKKCSSSLRPLTSFNSSQRHFP